MDSIDIEPFKVLAVVGVTTNGGTKVLLMREKWYLCDLINGGNYHIVVDERGTGSWYSASYFKTAIQIRNEKLTEILDEFGNT